MPGSEFTYVVATGKSFPEAVVALRKAAEAAKWGILGDYDFSEILAAKGFPQTEPVKSLDICAPAHAHNMMAVERLTGLCMPCSVLVFTERGQTQIAAMRPGSVMPQLFPQAAQRLGDLAKQIDAEIQSILDAAAR